MSVEKFIFYRAGMVPVRLCRLADELKRLDYRLVLGGGFALDNVEFGLVSTCGLVSLSNDSIRHIAISAYVGLKFSMKNF